MSEPETAWDRDAMLRGLGGDQNLFREVLRIFLEEAPRAVAIQRDAAELGDTVVMERIAHTLRGDLAYLALPALVKLAGESEDASRRGDLEQARPLALTLEQAIMAVCLEVRKSLRSGGARYQAVGARHQP
jgi:HPt (histidine-containing phosphotransfer) domain-containing protein